MLRKLSETFTATHLVALVGIAVLAPTTVFAVNSVTNIAITDAKSGDTATVGVSHNLNVYDPIAGYANNPLNYVRISSGCSNGAGELSYAPPSGKALIIKSADYSYFSGTNGGDNYIYLETNSESYISGLESVDAVGSKSANFGNGVYLRNGESLETFCSSAGFFHIAIAGYLVPSTAVPPVGALGQSIRPTQSVVKDGRRM